MSKTKNTVTQKEFLKLVKKEQGGVIQFHLTRAQMEKFIEHSLVKTSNFARETSDTSHLIKFFHQGTTSFIINKVAFGSIFYLEDNQVDLSLNTVYSNVRFEYEGEISKPLITKLRDSFVAR